MFSQRNPLFWTEVGLAVVAGLWTLIHIILELSGSTGGDGWDVGLLILFIIAVVVAFMHYGQERSALAASGSSEQFPEPAISKFFFGSAGSATMWFVVRMYVGAEWFSAGWEKVTSPAWGTSGTALKGFATNALTLAGGAHPAVQGWYASFLQGVVIPGAGFFSFLVSWGELAVGLGLLFGVLTGIAAGFGVLMNFNYLLAGTVSTNPILGMLGLFLCISWRVCGWFGVDRWLLPALGLPWKPGSWFRNEPPVPSQTT